MSGGQAWSLCLKFRQRLRTNMGDTLGDDHHDRGSTDSANVNLDGNDSATAIDDANKVLAVIIHVTAILVALAWRPIPARLTAHGGGDKRDFVDDTGSGIAHNLRDDDALP